ncbi:MAG: bifunctional adenosylcobinamide kinase/adenosylcobinamide-phosphate guanylyltransferase [Spirochaetota bacterium]
MTTIVLITGGARSGKSTYAERLASAAVRRSALKRPAAYIATGMALDDEFKERIAHHKARRTTEFTSYEEPYAIDSAAARAFDRHDVVLLECVTTWLGNMLCKPSDDAHVYDVVSRLLSAAGVSSTTAEDPIDMLRTGTLSAGPVDAIAGAGRVLIIVSNELGLGIVPADAESRRYRDMHGRINQMIASAAGIVVFVASGVPVRLK